MMGEPVGRQDRLFYEFCLEGRVPAPVPGGGAEPGRPLGEVAVVPPDLFLDALVLGSCTHRALSTCCHLFPEGPLIHSVRVTDRQRASTRLSRMLAQLVAVR